MKKDRFISCESGSEISCLRSCKILTGMLKGPLPLFAAREEIQDMISVLSTGEIKKELLQGCPKTFSIGFRRERFFLSNIFSYIREIIIEGISNYCWIRCKGGINVNRRW